MSGFSESRAAAERAPLRIERGGRRLRAWAVALLALALIASLALAAPAGAGRRTAWKITLTAVPTSGLTGTQATLTAVANKRFGGRRLYINIWRENRHVVLKTCRTRTCKVVVTPPGDANPSPAPTTTDTTYEADVSNAPRRPGVHALALGRVTVSRTSPTCHPPSCPTM